MPPAVKEIDRGWKAITEVFKRFSQGKTAAVGVQGEKGEQATPDHGNLTNAELAAIPEFGTQDGHVPERSFLRSTYAENEKWIEEQTKKIAVKRVFEGKDPIPEIRIMGEEFRTKVLEKIRSNIPPALAETTILAKAGETTALIDTGQLFNAISSEVVDPQEKRSQ